MTIWEEHAKRTRRQEELKRLDEWLRTLHEKRPFTFHLLTLAIAVVVASVAIGISALLDTLSK